VRPNATLEFNEEIGREMIDSREGYGQWGQRIGSKSAVILGVMALAVEIHHVARSQLSFFIPK
jgi:hypothetical protein